MSSSSIPDSISSEALESFAEQAAAIEKHASDKTMTPEEMRELVASTVEELTDKFDSIFGYKLVAHYALYCLYKHHNTAHGAICEDGDYDAALCWGRDAGWIQLMLKGLTDIACGTEDFLFSDD